MTIINRPVKLQDGEVYTHHEVTAVDVSAGTIRISVSSWNDDGSKATASQFVGQSSELEEYVFGASTELLEELHDFAEYVDPLDEVLPILTDEQAEQLVNVFPTWKLGKVYAIGDRVRYDGGLFKCLQAHTSQEGWEPGKAVSLWVAIIEPPSPDVPPEWVQPTGAHDAYSKGDKVTHNGKVWVSDIDANVYEPGIYGWTEVV